MNTARKIFALGVALLMLAGCGGSARPAEKAGVVYLDPNAAPTAAAAAPRPTETEAPAKPTEAPAKESTEEPTEAGPELYFEYRGVRIEPMMEAAPVLAALGEPLRVFEADSCAYLGKDLFYAFPGVELTVNQVEDTERITSLQVVDDTVTTPQGLRIYDEEEKLLSLLGGTEDDGVYTYRSGRVELLVQVKTVENGSRRVWSIEYRAADGQ